MGLEPSWPMGRRSDRGDPSVASQSHLLLNAVRLHNASVRTKIATPSSFSWTACWGPKEFGPLERSRFFKYSTPLLAASSYDVLYRKHVRVDIHIHNIHAQKILHYTPCIYIIRYTAYIIQKTLFMIRCTCTRTCRSTDAFTYA